MRNLIILTHDDKPWTELEAYISTKPSKSSALDASMLNSDHYADSPLQMEFHKELSSIVCLPLRHWSQQRSTR